METKRRVCAASAAGLLGAMLGLVLGGCESLSRPSPDSGGVSASGAASTVADTRGGPAQSTSGENGAASADAMNRPNALASNATAFATRNALYTPARFSDMPGWDTDDLVESWQAFTVSCTVLGKKADWSVPCAAARKVDPQQRASVRRFFEENFVVYQIRDLNRVAVGTLTGYYEPMLNGSRRYSPPYVYPVYGTPRDMLFLDVRLFPRGTLNGAVAAHIENREVVPISVVSTSNLHGVYPLELRDAVPDIRDKKLRLRLDSNRIVRYYSREEIEHGKLDAPIIAYVDDAAMLYSMQLQGSGKVRLVDGSVIRLAYSEQNGFPFNPPIATAHSSGRKILVRGEELDLDATGTITATPEAPDSPDHPPRSRLLQDDPSSSDPAQTLSGNTTGDVTPMTRDGDSGTRGAPASVSTTNRDWYSVQGATPAVHPAADSGHAKLAKAGAMPSPSLGGSPFNYTFATSDPSYIFFRQVQDTATGPFGALGVPLTPHYSAAVDTRITPLGTPVFVSTTNASGGHEPINRLLMAQDAGGAIRGALRIDYFFGSGREAQTQASRTRMPVQMWVLLPKGMRIAAKAKGIAKVRGGPVTSTLDCLVEEAGSCVEDAP